MCSHSSCATQVSSLSCLLLSNSPRATQKASTRLKAVQTEDMLASFCCCSLTQVRSVSGLSPQRWKHVMTLWLRHRLGPCRVIYLLNRRGELNQYLLLPSAPTQDGEEKTVWPGCHYGSATIRHLFLNFLLIVVVLPHQPSHLCKAPHFLIHSLSSSFLLIYLSSSLCVLISYSS